MSGSGSFGWAQTNQALTQPAFVKLQIVRTRYSYPSECFPSTMRLWHNTCISRVLRYDKLHISISPKVHVEWWLYVYMRATNKASLWIWCVHQSNKEDTHACPDAHENNKHTSTLKTCSACCCCSLTRQLVLATKTAPTWISANQGGAMNWNGYKQTRETNTTDNSIPKSPISDWLLLLYIHIIFKIWWWWW